MPGASPISGFTVIFPDLADSEGDIAIHPIDTEGREHPPLAIAVPVSLRSLRAEVEGSHPLKSVLKAALPDFYPKVVFDIGANVGQSRLPLEGMFPGAVVHSFEPAPSTFAELAKLFANDRALLHQIALGNRDGTTAFTDRPLSAGNRVSDQGETTVKIARIDTYSREIGIESIGYVKIDAEGHELEILQGCENLLPSVDMIECEVSANRYNRFHRSFEDISSHLFDRNFSLFQIFEQTMEFQDGGRPLLRRFNAVFINNTMVGDLDSISMK